MPSRANSAAIRASHDAAAVLEYMKDPVGNDAKISEWLTAKSEAEAELAKLNAERASIALAMKGLDEERGALTIWRAELTTEAHDVEVRKCDVVRREEFLAVAEPKLDADRRQLTADKAEHVAAVADCIDRLQRLAPQCPDEIVFKTEDL